MNPSWSNKRTIWLLLWAGVLFVVAALALLLPVRGSNLTTGSAGWTAQGCFAQDATYPATHFDRQITAHERQGVTFWGSWCGSDATTGELRSPVFRAPKILELFVSGYWGREDRPGLQVFLEREDNHKRVPLPTRRQPGELWVKLYWWMADDVRDQPVRLIAQDSEGDTGGWLALSNPRSQTALNFYRLQFKSWARTVSVFLFEFDLFLLPGLAAASALTASSKRPIAPIYLVMVVICTGATLGYLAFWEFFFSKTFGQFASGAIYVGALGLLVSLRGSVKSTVKAIREPFLFVALAALCYTSFYFLFSDPFLPGAGYASDRFFLAMLPADNIIPKIFADRIYERKSVRPFCCDDWLSSDRPPLQTGIVLMERPLLRPEPNRSELDYQVLATGLQCFWICGIWCLLTVIGTERRRIRQLIGFLIFSGFLFYNSVYAWPKLLAATCILFLLTILFDIGRNKRALTNFEAVLAADCLGLALMAHPGSVFSLAIFVVLLVRLRRFFRLRQVALGLLLVSAFYLPWSAYQNYVDPPGNRLLKMHLGGVGKVDSRTTWEAIRDTYRSHTWRQHVYIKWLNALHLGGDDFFDSYGLTDWAGPHIDHEATERSRNVQRSYMWNAVGLANLGWLAGLFLLVKRRWKGLAIPYAGWLIAAALANLIFWVIITFGPRESETAHSSYADILLLSVGLMSFILTLPRVFYLLLFGWQLFNFFVLWVWSAPARIPPPVTLQWPMMTVGVGLTLVLLWLTLRPKEVFPEEEIREFDLIARC